MKVSILYFAGCPNHPPTARRVREVTAELGIEANVEEVEVAGPEESRRLGFLGSPSVQVDGVDIEPAARHRTDYGMSCRLYDTPDGLPSPEMLRRAMGAIQAAYKPPESGPAMNPAGNGCCRSAPSHAAVETSQNPTGGRLVGVAAVGSVATAMLSSACCWLPLVLVVFGASAAGVSAMLGPWRTPFVIAAVTMLSLSLYLTYFRRAAAGSGCSAGAASPRSRFGRATWWVSAVLVTVFIFFPQAVRPFAGDSPRPGAALTNRAGRELIFTVEGMSCEACAATVRAQLAKLDGVQEIHVDYATKTARVVGSGDALVPEIIEAIQRAGFSSALCDGES